MYVTVFCVTFQAFVQLLWSYTRNTEILECTQ